jgi:hypothetical protein
MDEEIDRLQKRSGNLIDVDTASENDIVYTTMAELDENGNTFEGGVYSDSTPILIQSIKNEASKHKVNVSPTN